MSIFRSILPIDKSLCALSFTSLLPQANKWIGSFSFYHHQAVKGERLRRNVLGNRSMHYLVSASMPLSIQPANRTGHHDIWKCLRRFSSAFSSRLKGKFFLNVMKIRCWYQTALKNTAKKCVIWRTYCGISHTYFWKPRRTGVSEGLKKLKMRHITQFY